MQLEKQVCNLKLARKLKKLGVEQNSIWDWCKINNKWTVEWAYGDEPIKASQYAAAFTVAELGEMLPVEVPASNKGMFSGLLEYRSDREDGNGRRWRVVYQDMHFEFSNSEADARAQMVIYLLEHKIIALPHANGDATA
jgi:hypothetical protein